MDKIIKDLTEMTTVGDTVLLEVQSTAEALTKKATVYNVTKTERDARAAMDTAIITGAGLEADGGCSFTSTNYLDSETSLKGAIERLDTQIKSQEAAIETSPVVIAEVELSTVELGQLNTYKKTLVNIGSQPAGQTTVIMPVSAMLILYQDGNALSYGEDWYIGYDSGGDPAIQSTEYIWKIPQAFIEDNNGNNVVNVPELLIGGGSKTGRIDANLILWSPTSDHGGGTITSTLKVVVAYKKINVTEASGGT